MTNDQNIAASLIRLLQKFQLAAERQLEEKNLPKIQVSETISKIALVYEKIRNTIDYKEAHLLRKNATERILKRRLLTTHDPQIIAKPLILELIRAGYLKNNEVSENYIKNVEEVINKYIILKLYLNQLYKNKELNELNDWLTSVMAVEIEETLVSTEKEDAIVELIYENVNKNINFLDPSLTDEEKSILLYLAIHKAVNKSDEAILSYHLFRYFLPILPTEKNEIIEEEILNTIAGFRELKTKIYYFLNHPIKNNLLKAIKKIVVPYVILKDFIEEHPDSAYQRLLSSNYLEEFIKSDCKKRYREAQTRLHRGAVRSITYLFITKMALVLILEMPLDLYIENQVNYFSLGINVLFPPFLMFLIGLMIRVPSKKNTQKILEEVIKIVYSQKPQKTIIRIKKPVPYGSFLDITFKILYSVLFLLSFSLIIYILNKFQFNILSGFIFILFLCLISFFGTTLRQTAKEYQVLTPRDSFITLVLDLISLPILAMGKFISGKLSKINFFIFIFDFIIEAPFKTIIEVIEEWLSFIREKKEEIAT